MAKRSVKKARQRAPAAPPSPSSRRQFWLGVLAAAAVLVPLAVVGVVLASSGGEEREDPQAAVRDSIETEAAELRRITKVRDKEQVKELTERVRGFADDLGPVVDGIARTLPPGNDDKVGPLASPADVRDWVQTTRAVRGYFADSVSGETGTNVARGAFATAAGSVAELVETYRLALDDAPLLERVRGQRDVAMRAWETATVQLDAINIAVGYGHQHVPALGAGGLPPDDLPEGTGALDGG